MHKVGYKAVKSPECVKKNLKLGLGVVPGEQSFFHENERNDQERSHRSEKRTNA